MKREPLLPEKYYHIYNRAIGSEQLFKTPDNYQYFLKKYQLYIPKVVDTLAYCLMPNHFHFLVKIKDENTVQKALDLPEQEPSAIVSKQFSKLFSCYTQSFNKVNRRMGSLFIANFKRKLISDENYLSQVIFYIHNNPVHHGFKKCIDDWPYSSYLELLSSTPTFLDREELLAWFGGQAAFIEFHSRDESFRRLEDVTLER